MRENSAIAVVDLCLDLERELGEARGLEPAPCRHEWGFVPPERSAGVIRECRGYGVFVCHKCGKIRPVEATDRVTKLRDILFYYAKRERHRRQGENL